MRSSVGSRELKTRLGADVIELAVVDASQLARAAELVAPLATEQPFVDESEGRLRFSAVSGSTALMDTLRRLDEAEIPLRDLGLRRPSLDDVFLALTGHGADDAEREQADAPAAQGRRGRKA